jgi:hypothetical protein
MAATNQIAQLAAAASFTASLAGWLAGWLANYRLPGIDGVEF